MNGKNAVIGVFLLLCVEVLTAQALGDANKDGQVDIIDALNIARVYVGMEVDNFDANFGDANLDGTISIVDSVLVAQNYVGIKPVLPAFLNDIGITPDYPANWDIVMKEFPLLTPEQCELLFDNGFLILEDKYQDTLSAAYEKYMNEPRLPKVLTLDSLFHIFHLTISHMNETVERKYLLPALDNFVSGLLTRLKSEYFAMESGDSFYDAIEELLIRIVVAKNLIQGTAYSESDLPAPLAASIEGYLQKVREYNVVDGEEDYTSYKPRGHYANNSNDTYRTLLIRYFQAMTWLQRYVLDINDNSDLRQIILFTHFIFQDAGLSESYRFINDFLIKMKGLSGDFTLDQIETELQTAQPDNYHVLGYRAFNSDESIIALSEALKNLDDVNQVFRLISKVETLDMTILKNTHTPKISDRLWPSGLDVAAGFFDSPAAIRILEESPYGEQILSVFETFSPEKTDFFDSELNDSVVWRWFKILRDLSYEIPSTISYSTIDLDQWEIKSLNTQLSLWTEFYSDTANCEAPTPEPTPGATPSPIVGPGDVVLRIEPAELSVPMNTPFSLEIRLDIHDSNVAAYGFDIEYSRDLIFIDRSRFPEGVSSGADGFFSAAAINSTGQLKVSGFDVNGIGPGYNLHLLTIDFISKSQSGTTAVSLYVDKITNVNGISVTASDIISYVTVDGTDSIRYGDVNGDNAINIVDALLIARYFINMDSVSIDRGAADVNRDGYINIVDALLIAQYYIGLIDTFHDPTSTPEPGHTPSPTHPNATATPTSEATPLPSVSPEPDAGYQFIEPCPEAFENVAMLAANMGEFLSEHQIAFDHMEKFYELSEIAMELSVIAVESTNNYRLSDEHRNYINDWGYKISKEYFFVDDLSSFFNEHEGNTRVIADVYNNNDFVLNIGVGPLKPILMMMNYPGDNRKYVAIGYILSYYELQDENYTRYTIEEWETKLNQGNINQPDWFLPLQKDP